MFTRATLVVAATALLIAANASHAGAAVGSFALSPTSGPPGTVVHLSGTGCAPGLLLDPALDFAHVVAATVPPASLHLAVSSNGSWSGTFVVPANEPAAPVAVTAVCVSDGLQSLLTAYLPQTFTVTAASTPTTAPSAPPATDPVVTTIPTPAAPGPTTPNSTGTSPTTAPRASRGGSGGGSDGGGTAPGSGTPGAGAPQDPGANPASTHGPGASAGETGTASGDRTSTAIGQRGALAADLSAPELRLVRHGSGGGLTWLAWLLLVVLIVACASAWAWLRWGRRPKGTQ